MILTTFPGETRNSPAADILSLLQERGASVEYHDPHVEAFRDAKARWHHGASLDHVLTADVVVVVTPHRAIDWDRVFDEAPLVVDTVDVSRGCVTRARQVLRLGAGWADPDRALSQELVSDRDPATDYLGNPTPSAPVP